MRLFIVQSAGGHEVDTQVYLDRSEIAAMFTAADLDTAEREGRVDTDDAETVIVAEVAPRWTDELKDLACIGQDLRVGDVPDGTGRPLVDVREWEDCMAVSDGETGWTIDFDTIVFLSRRGAPEPQEG